MAKKVLKEQKYDCTEDTMNHIERVRALINKCCVLLIERANNHDMSKLSDEEKPLFDEYTPKLKEMKYQSQEYKDCLAKLKPALDHHYATNRHHPEHFENGMKEFNLIDLLEFFCDNLAATERMKNGGNIVRSIFQNQIREKFEFSDDVRALLLQTARLYVGDEKYKELYDQAKEELSKDEKFKKAFD